MANRFYTFMVIPERTSKVRKWVISKSLLRTFWIGALAVFILGVFTSLMTLRYLVRWGEFQEARLKNQYLEGELQTIRAKLDTANATLVRVQSFEQKLRGLANLDRPASDVGIGPISSDDEQALLHRGDSPTLVAKAENAPDPNDAYRVHSLELSINDLHTRSILTEQSLQDTYELLKDQESFLASRPSIWPTRGWVTSQFGYRVSPFTGMRQLHEGIDVASSMGARVLAPADGMVTETGTEQSYGKIVVLNHGYGIVTRYAHNSEILVKMGQKIRRGDVIATVGSTGRSTGPHLHYEVRVNGLPVNPNRYILN